jgi:hypothetical protein
MKQDIHDQTTDLKGITEGSNAGCLEKGEVIIVCRSRIKNEEFL